MDTELLGHSYYGSCLPLINDVRQIMTANLPPSDRNLEPKPMGQTVPAWTFPQWTVPRDDADLKDTPKGQETP
jgi:hypothetical protein